MDYMKSAVSMPFSDTAMFADDASTLEDISDQIVEFMSDSKFPNLFSLSQTHCPPVCLYVCPSVEILFSFIIALI